MRRTGCDPSGPQVTGVALRSVLVTGRPPAPKTLHMSGGKDGNPSCKLTPGRPTKSRLPQIGRRSPPALRRDDVLNHHIW